MTDPYRRAANAYSTRNGAVVDQRRLEADALLRAASRIEDVRNGWRPARLAELDAALLNNRKLWTIFATEVTSDDSALPVELRNAIASIAVFVFKRSFEALATPSPELMQPLIDINRTLAAGLLGQPEPAAA